MRKLTRIKKGERRRKPDRAKTKSKIRFAMVSRNQKMNKMDLMRDKKYTPIF